MNVTAKELEAIRRQFPDQISRLSTGYTTNDELPSTDPRGYGLAVPSKETANYIKSYEQARKLITDDGRNNGVAMPKMSVERLMSGVEVDARNDDITNFKNYVTTSYFGADDSVHESAREWDKKHTLYEWEQYKKQFPEFLSDTYLRAKLILELNVLFAKMTIYQQPRTRREFMLLYLYEQDKQKWYEIEEGGMYVRVDEVPEGHTADELNQIPRGHKRRPTVSHLISPVIIKELLNIPMNEKTMQHPVDLTRPRNKFRNTDAITSNIANNASIKNIRYVNDDGTSKTHHLTSFLSEQPFKDITRDVTGGSRIWFI